MEVWKNRDKKPLVFPVASWLLRGGRGKAIDACSVDKFKTYTKFTNEAESSRSIITATGGEGITGSNDSSEGRLHLNRLRDCLRWFVLCWNMVSTWTAWFLDYDSSCTKVSM